MAVKIEGRQAQTELDLRVAVRMFHPGELFLVRFAVVAGVPHLEQLGDLAEEGQLKILECPGKPEPVLGVLDSGTWREPRARTRLIQIGATFNWETFTKLFLDKKLIEAITPYE